jgi:hypothetical protein
MCDDLYTENIRRHAVIKSDGKQIQDERPKHRVDRTSDVGVYEKHLCSAMDLGLKALAQAWDP